jgi:hypothetical protein
MWVSYLTNKIGNDFPGERLSKLMVEMRAEDKDKNEWQSKKKRGLRSRSTPKASETIWFLYSRHTMPDVIDPDRDWRKLYIRWKPRN